MNIEEAAKFAGLQKSFVKKLHEDGIVDNPVSDADLKGLTIIAHIHGKAWYLRKLLAPLPMQVRKKIVMEGSLTRVERYALSLYLNARPGERISVEDISQQIHSRFGVKLSRDQIARIRQIAYDRRRRFPPSKKE